MTVWLFTLLFSGCRMPDSAPTDRSERLASALGMEVLERVSVQSLEGEPLSYPGYTVRPVRLEVFKDFRISGALWLPDSPPPFPTLLLAHGHFGEGKSSGESQAPAHVMADRGWAVLAMDTPGVEEGDLPGRQIHHAEGAHNRALLAAANTSAMALQVHGLQAGLDYLESREDIGPISVGGASGGAVQALFLARIDPRPERVVLASYVPMPREAQAGGCACDTVPGWPGPDPSLIEDMTRPSLWLSELEQPAPKGLPDTATFEVLPSPHGFAPALIQRTADWLDKQAAKGSSKPIPNPIPHTPSTSLASLDLGSATIFNLVESAPSKRWKPDPAEMVPHVVECSGAGPAILLAGGTTTAQQAISNAGYQTCRLEFSPGETSLAASIATESPLANRAAGALLSAMSEVQAIGVFATRAWGVAAEGAGVPYVLGDPLQKLEDINPKIDPAWVHVPGIWWTENFYTSAMSVGTNPDKLVEALIQHAQSRPKPEARP
ncbi:MAG: hypothetical protein VX519_11550 [Myxococcota bacterium]|nr:hypothetical protein [Myxococcota bacterium]